MEVHAVAGGAPTVGDEIETVFVRRLRDEMRFDSPAALATQIARDVEEARSALAW
jgi:FAD synthase